MKSRPEVRKMIPLLNLEAAQAREGSPYSHLEVVLRYSEGGTNWFSGNQNPQGYVLGFTGVNVKDGAVSFFIGSGWNLAFLVQPATRFNRNTLAKLAAALNFEALAAKFEANDLQGIREVVSLTRSVAA